MATLMLGESTDTIEMDMFTLQMAIFKWYIYMKQDLDHQGWKNVRAMRAPLSDRLEVCG